MTMTLWLLDVSTCQIPEWVAEGGRIQPREILHLTVAFDHDVLDGSPAGLRATACQTARNQAWAFYAGTG